MTTQPTVQSPESAQTKSRAGYESRLSCYLPVESGRRT